MSMKADQERVDDQRNEKLAISNNNAVNDNREGKKNIDIDLNTRSGGADVKKMLADNDSNTSIQQKVNEQVEVSGFSIPFFH